MDLERVLNQVAKSYPDYMIAKELRDVPRVAFNIRLALGGATPSGASICDIGGGVGLFSVGCAALGMQVLLVDDFGDKINQHVRDEPFRVHERYGVEILSRDVIAAGIGDVDRHFDVVTTFDSMEHWHASPKGLFSDVMMRLLRPGGRFVLGVPNCVNLRKRFTVPFGAGKWSSMQEWYEESSFRGHVREPDVSDLYYIASDMGLKDVRIYGRNWLGHQSPNKLIRAATKVADYPLRLLPTLCSDIYLAAIKPTKR